MSTYMHLLFVIISIRIKFFPFSLHYFFTIYIQYAPLPTIITTSTPTTYQTFEIPSSSCSSSPSSTTPSFGDCAPMSFNELEKIMSAYPDTLNKRLKELVEYNLVEPMVHVVDGKNRIKHRLTPKGKQLMAKLNDFIKLAEELESKILL